MLLKREKPSMCSWIWYVGLWGAGGESAIAAAGVCSLILPPPPPPPPPYACMHARLTHALTRTRTHTRPSPQIVSESPFVTRDLLESCFPYALLRDAYNSVYRKPQVCCACDSHIILIVNVHYRGALFQAVVYVQLYTTGGVICDSAWENRNRPLYYNFRFRDIGTTLKPAIHSMQQ